MTWIPLLLADPSPSLRRLVLRELLDKPGDDPEVRELDALRLSDPLVSPVLDAQEPDGSWRHGDLAWHGGVLRMTLLALMRLGYLGFGPDNSAVQRGAEFLFAQQRDDGAWPLPGDRDETEPAEDREGYTMMPGQTTLPLRALAMCGYAADPRAERAYEWLLAQRLDDGAWPTGIAAGGVYGRVAGYRKLAHSRWGCRANTTGALLCLAHHPTRRSSEAARRALDLLLGRETKEAHALGFEVARLTGAEPVRGFTTFYARFDLAMVLDLCWRVGATRDDLRVAGIVTFVEGLQGEYGLWDYARPQTARWLTFDLLRSLAHLDATGDWRSDEPRTPFQAYPKRRERY